jgi:sugar-specific transcriptional regulator TrmB
MLSGLSDIYLIHLKEPMEKSVKSKVVNFLRQIGLNGEQSNVYMYLQEHGPSTVLAISRGLKTGRTKLYPALDEMVEKQVLAVHERHYGTTYEALPPENLEFLVSEHERKATVLRHNLPSAVHALNLTRLNSPATSKVIEYRGVDGIKQMVWNQSKAKEYFKVYELANLDKHLPPHFAEKMRQEWTRKGIKSYDLTNRRDWRLQTKVEAYRSLNEARYIEPSLLQIEFETIIYNNVVSLISYDNDDIFGVEIHNSKLARQQEQLFDMLWRGAEPVSS